jgi:putative ABC transport system permease protein
VVTYAKLRENTDEDVLEAKLTTLGEKRVKPSCERYGIDYDQIVAGKGGWNFYLQPVRDIRLHSVNTSETASGRWEISPMSGFSGSSGFLC